MSSNQNTSHAVMAQRHEAADSLDDFPTPPWATRALCEWLYHKGHATLQDLVNEPACNRGHMVRPLKEFFTVAASDIHDYGCGYPVEDYLTAPPMLFDWTITNPPFRLAEEFYRKARKSSEKGVAFFLRTNFLESVGRYKNMFLPDPPSHILQFSERVVLHKGKLSPKGSTATSYCWVIWTHRDGPTRFLWIPPCRKRLEYPHDYF